MTRSKDAPAALLVCRDCLEAIGKKGEKKRDSVEARLIALQAAAPAELGVALEIERGGCLDVCPRKAVAVALARGREGAAFVLKPKDEPADALARLRKAARALDE